MSDMEMAILATQTRAYLTLLREYVNFGNAEASFQAVNDALVELINDSSVRIVTKCGAA